MASRTEVTSVAVNMMMNTFPFEDGIHEPFLLRDIENIYDIDGNIKSYYVTFKDMKGCYCGYVIVNASKLENPVVEFSVGKSSFIEESRRNILNISCNANLTYLGNGVYGIHTEQNRLYEMVDGGCIETDVREFKKLQRIRSENDSENNEYWELWKEQLAAYNRAFDLERRKILYSSGDEKNYIYYPEDYEYTDAVEKMVPGGTMYYFTYRYFGGNNICVPTAATNLCYYWYKRDSKHFAGLYRDSWDNVFNTLADYMYTDTSSGTYYANAYNGLRLYFNEAGFKYSLECSSETYNGRLIVNEIDAGYPVNLLLSYHNTYKNHAVLGIGYKKFVYSGRESIYIRIADGWGDDDSTLHIPNRYVWNGDKGSWTYFSFRPEGY